MTDTTTILDDERDQDTLGGRISRAREASGLSAKEAAEQLGVTQKTYDDWEADRNDPRANRLTMLAGCLGVSATWLLYGIGRSPISETTDEEIQVLSDQMERLKTLHEKTTQSIEMLEQSINRLVNREA
ncbi:MAG: helix-turn-helix domain-containing protein [Pseudomonadota bacterium]